MKIYDTPEEITLFRMKALIGALKLETLGMKRKGRSVYSIIKEEFEIKGGKQKVLEQLQTLYNEAQLKRN